MKVRKSKGERKRWEKQGYSEGKVKDEVYKT